MSELLKIYVQNNEKIPIRQLNKLNKNLLKTHFYSHIEYVFNKFTNGYLEYSRRYYKLVYDFIGDEEIKMLIDYLENYEYGDDDDDDDSQRKILREWVGYRAEMLEKIYDKVGIQKLKEGILDYFNGDYLSDYGKLFEITFYPKGISKLNSLSAFFKKYGNLLDYFTDVFLIKIYSEFGKNDKFFTKDKLTDLLNEIGIVNLNNHIIRLVNGDVLDGDGIKVEYIFNFHKLYDKNINKNELKNLYYKYKHLISHEDLEHLSLKLLQYSTRHYIGLMPIELLDKLNDFDILSKEKIYQYLPIEYVEKYNLWNKFNDGLMIIFYDIYINAVQNAKITYTDPSFRGTNASYIMSRDVKIPKDILIKKIEEKYTWIRKLFGEIYSERHLKYFRDKLYEFVDNIYNNDIKL